MKKVDITLRRGHIGRVGALVMGVVKPEARIGTKTVVGAKDPEAALCTCVYGSLAYDPDCPVHRHE